jgi:Ser/Thr protein kinase RdoA (MazF antagonist)
VSEILARRTQIAQERERFQAWLHQLDASGRSLLFGPTHGDYYPHNLLVEDHQIRAVLDWDECQPEWFVYELARATWEFCQNKNSHTLDRVRAFAFLRAYQDAGGPVPSYDFDLLLPLMRCVRLIEALFALEQARRGEPWDAAYTLHNLISLEKLQHVELNIS